MHAAVCLLRAGQPRSAGDAAKLGQFIGQFSWVTGDPIVLKGLSNEFGQFHVPYWYYFWDSISYHWFHIQIRGKNINSGNPLKIFEGFDKSIMDCEKEKSEISVRIVGWRDEP